MTIPTFTFGTAVTVSNAGTATVTLLSGSAGDAHMLLVGSDYGPGGVDNIVFPANDADDTFTQIEQVQGNTSNCQAAAAWRAHTGSEPTTVDVGITNSSGTQTVVWPVLVSGADTSDFIDQVGTVLDTGNSTSHSIPGVTPGGVDTLAFAIITGDGADTTDHTWTNFTEQAESGLGGGSGVGASWATQGNSTAAAISAESVGFNASDGASGFMFTVNPATGPSPSSNGKVTQSVLNNSALTNSNVVVL